MKQTKKRKADASVESIVRRDEPFDWSAKTDEEIVSEGLSLAREFYKAYGYEVPEGFKFYESQHPQELSMWDLAVIAFEALTGTDLNDALANIGE
jgi:hypothetical protein